MFALEYNFLAVLDRSEADMKVSTIDSPRYFFMFGFIWKMATKLAKVVEVYENFEAFRRQTAFAMTTFFNFRSKVLHCDAISCWLLVHKRIYQWRNKTALGLQHSYPFIRISIQFHGFHVELFFYAAADFIFPFCCSTILHNMK